MKRYHRYSMYPWYLWSPIWKALNAGNKHHHAQMDTNWFTGKSHLIFRFEVQNNERLG